MPERTDKYEDLTPHHRREKDENLIEAEKWFDEYIELAGHTNPTLKDAFISGWNQYRAKCKNLYSMEDIMNITN